jgi:hypothetical protein
MPNGVRDRLYRAATAGVLAEGGEPTMTTTLHFWGPSEPRVLWRLAKDGLVVEAWLVATPDVGFELRILKGEELLQRRVCLPAGEFLQAAEAKRLELVIHGWTPH